ncbi:MAG: heme exporter protein CcmD [Novosphingobium sp.]
MHEGLNHWTFVIASYAIAVAGTAILVISSLLAMRRAEARRDQARER